MVHIINNTTYNINEDYIAQNSNPIPLYLVFELRISGEYLKGAEKDTIIDHIEASLLRNEYYSIQFMCNKIVRDSDGKFITEKCNCDILHNPFLIKRKEGSLEFKVTLIDILTAAECVLSNEEYACLLFRPALNKLD